jgi:hypothetical protein
MRLKDAVRRGLIAEVSKVGADLDTLSIYTRGMIAIIDDLKQQAKKDARYEGVVVHWANRARRTLEEFARHNSILTEMFLQRARGEIQVPEAWIQHLLMDLSQTEEGRQKLAAWGDALDCLLALDNIPISSLVAAWQACSFEATRTPDEEPATYLAVTNAPDTLHQWDDEQQHPYAIEITRMLQSGDITPVTNLVEENSWDTTSGRLCALSKALEFMERQTGATWVVTSDDGYTRFAPNAEVQRIRNGVIGKWKELTTKRPK